MKINLANKMTIFRIVLIPVFILFFIVGNDTNNISFIGININVYRLISGIIFIVASITDMMDGLIARKFNMVTNFGKLMDPLADKMLVLSAIILISNYNQIINSMWVVIIVIREIIISSIRLIALERGVVIHASKYGKYKTAFQMIAIILFLFNIQNINIIFYNFVYLIFYISEFFVVISLIDYIIKNLIVIIEGINE